MNDVDKSTRVYPTCAGCEWFIKTPEFGEASGLCRYNPPVPILVPCEQGKLILESVFPMVNKDWSCAMHSVYDEGEDDVTE